MRLFDVPVKADPDLPPLQGTERQCPWAEQIRAGKLADAEKLVRQMQEVERAYRQGGKIEQAKAQLAELRKAASALERLKQKTWAKVWIDHRDNTALELLSGAEAKPGDTWNRGPE